MDLPPLTQILAGIDNAIADFEATAPLARSENDRKLLNAAASDLRVIRTRMEKELPENLNSLKGLLEQMQAKGEGLAKDIEVQQAKLAKMEAAAAVRAATAAEAASNIPKPAVPEEPKVDLGMGAALRSDLLAKLFPEAKPADAFDPGKDIWQDWK